MTLSGTSMDAVSDYRVFHQAPSNDGYSSSLDRLADAFGDDVYEHPEYHGEADEETLRQLQAARGNPDATVRIYRALPPGIGAINPADWVTLSEAYAREHAIQADAADDWPIIHADVPAKLIFTDGNDLSEYGYDGPPLTGLPDAGPVKDMWSDRDVHYHAAHRALLDGTARAKLAADFADSELDYEQLAEKVGHDARTARKVVAGKATLAVYTVAAYFRALGHLPSDEDRAAHGADYEIITRLRAS